MNAKIDGTELAIMDAANIYGPHVEWGRKNAKVHIVLSRLAREGREMEGRE